MKIKFLTTLMIGLFLLISCAPGTPPVPTPDVAFISTSAAQTVVANFTLTAVSWTATPLPAPTDTPATSAPLDTPTAESGIGTVAPTLPVGTVGTVSTASTLTLCDYYTWDTTTVDVNIPDGTQMTPGQEFVKTWKIKNAGICTWGAGYKVVYSSGDQMSGQPQPLSGVIGPGQEVEISVQFKAPTKVGAYSSAWTLSNANGIRFFGIGAKPVYVKIVVKV